MTLYMLSMTHDYTNPVPYDAPEAQPIHAAVRAFTADLDSNGLLVFMGEPDVPTSATVVDVSAAEGRILNGTLINAPKHLCAFWVFRAADNDEAVEVAKRCSTAGRCEVEIRPFRHLPA